ncbi:MAG: hypothetical protein ACTSQY_08440, partial [Candidatus Odinarchaeia archaeon]
IYVYPKVEIIRHISGPVIRGEENTVHLFIKNCSSETVKQIIISEMILEGVEGFQRLFWEYKNLEPEQEIEVSYNFKPKAETKSIKFDSLRAKLRFTKFMPHMFFDYVNPVQYVDID